MPRSPMPSAALLVLLLAGCGEPPPFVAAEVPHGSLARRDGLWLMQLDGTPAERGAAAGRLVGAQIRWALPRYLRATLKTREVTGYPLELADRLWPELPAPHREQLEALADSAGVDRRQLLLANLAPELVFSIMCSCLAVTPEASADGTLRLARNLDWLAGSVFRDLGLVVVERGARHAFASFTWPGLVGVATGINDAGLAVADLVVIGVNPKAEPGVPVLFALRHLLEETDSVAAATDRLQAAKRTVAQNYALVDPGAAVVLETDRQRFRRRDATATGYVAVANLFDEDRAAPEGSRVFALGQAARRRLDVAGLQAALAEVALGDLNVKAVILEPATRVAYVSFTGRPAAKGPYVRIDLAPLLPTPAPPAE